MEDRLYPPIMLLLYYFCLPFAANMRNSLTSTVAGAEWNAVDMLNAEFGMADVSTPLPQTPPSGITEGPSTAVNSTHR